ncbi:MAG: helix-turn-helix transcriptional regulator, partial [Clostridia bacterium]|nr:helix-turn-helix transcriptional regulator [Clostridia bacterium]
MAIMSPHMHYMRLADLIYSEYNQYNLRNEVEQMNGKTEMDYSVIGRRVRDRRAELGMTQSELAARIKVSASFIGHIERGEKIASLDTMMR